jgi:hypothetical protein
VITIIKLPARLNIEANVLQVKILNKLLDATPGTAYHDRLMILFSHSINRLVRRREKTGREKMLMLDLNYRVYE